MLDAQNTKLDKAAQLRLIRSGAEKEVKSLLY